MSRKVIQNQGAFLRGCLMLILFLIMGISLCTVIYLLLPPFFRVLAVLFVGSAWLFFIISQMGNNNLD